MTGSSSAEAPRSIWYAVGTRSWARASTWPVPGLRAKRGGHPADLEPEPVSRAEAVRRTEERDPHHTVAGVRGGQPDDPVADVLRPALLVHVAEPHEQVGVRVVAGHGQFGGHLAEYTAGPASGWLVKTSTSARASRDRLSRTPAVGVIVAPPTEGVGSAGS